LKNKFLAKKDLISFNNPIRQTPQMPVSDRLKLFLLHLKKNASQLAEEINVTQSAFNRVVKGDGLPSSKILIPLAELGLNINWLLIGDGEMLRDQNMTPDPNIEYQSKRKGDPKTYRDAIKQFYESSEDYKESWQKLLHEKDLRLQEKDAHLEEKERIIQTKNKMIELLEAKSQS
jgi:transcriptional regulator with XRE-family HTH domain